MEPEPTNKPEAPMTWEQLLAKFCEQNFDTSYKKAMREKSPVVMAEIYKAAADFHAREAFHRGAREQREICSGDPNDFERDLYDLANKYVNHGLKKPDLIHKLEYVTQSCRVS